MKGWFCWQMKSEIHQVWPDELLVQQMTFLTISPRVDPGGLSEAQAIQTIQKGEQKENSATHRKFTNAIQVDRQSKEYPSQIREYRILYQIIT